MAGEIDLPANVLRLVHRALPGMAHVELVLLLSRTAPRAWSAADAAAELRGDRMAVATAMADLQARHIAIEDTPGSFRFDDRDAELVADVAALRDAYERRPVMLVRALYERPTPMQAFSDAFRLRREE